MRNKKIVMINGCFDLLHVGHIHLLKEAKKLGDTLVIGLNSDRGRLNQGKRKPIIPQDERKEMLEAIKYVDKVYIFNERRPLKLIKKIKPYVIVFGEEGFKYDDMIKENTIDIAHFIPLQKRRNGIQSTTKIVEKIRRRKE